MASATAPAASVGPSLPSVPALTQPSTPVIPAPATPSILDPLKSVDISSLGLGRFASGEEVAAAIVLVRGQVGDALALLADDNFSPTCLRNATAYGVSPRLRFDIVVNNLVGHAVTTGKVMLQSDGTPWRPLVHIEGSPAIANGRVYVGGGAAGSPAANVAAVMASAAPPRHC